MAASATYGFAVDLDERLATLQELLRRHPRCAVAVFDAARNIVDVELAFDRVGIPVAGHLFVKAGLLAGFLAWSDVGRLSDAALEAGTRGTAMRSVRLRDGRHAALHLIEIDDTDRTTVAVIVPAAGSIVGTPPPTAVAASPRVGMVRCDAFGMITSASDSTRVLLRRRPDAPVEGTPITNLLYPDDVEPALANWAAAKEQRGVALRWRCRIIRDDASSLWVEATITNEIGPDGYGEVCVELDDVSREVEATEALVAERELIELLTETLPVGVAKFDAHGRIEHANGRLGDLLAPLDPQAVLDQALRGELADVELAAAFARLVQDGVGSRHVLDHRGEDGVLRSLEWTIRAAVAAGGAVTGGALCIADVTESARLREALEHRASTDGLTGCLNRSAAVSALEQELARVGPDRGVGLLFIDLDRFKHTNDSRGHAIGDAVLEVVARRLRAAVRTGDLVGRLGGDEFVVIAPGLLSARAALELAGSISSQLQGPASLEGVDVPIAASMGVAWSPTATAGELLGAADAAMYAAKQQRSSAPVLDCTLDPGADDRTSAGRSRPRPTW